MRARELQSLWVHGPAAGGILGIAWPPRAMPNVALSAMPKVAQGQVTMCTPSHVGGLLFEPRRGYRKKAGRFSARKGPDTIQKLAYGERMRRRDEATRVESLPDHGTNCGHAGICS